MPVSVYAVKHIHLTLFTGIDVLAAEPISRGGVHSVDR